MKKSPALSVVVLCYRGGEHIVPYIEEINSELIHANIAFEIVLVANFDSPEDITPEVVQKLSLSHHNYVALAEHKRGKMGWDLKSGLAAAKGEYLAFVDGDGQTMASDIVRLYSLIQTEDLDFCKVYRIKRSDFLTRRIISRVYNLLFRVLFPRISLRDINAKPKLMTRTAYHQMRLTSDDWFIDAEMILEASRLRLRLGEIPGEALANSWRASFVRPWAIFEFLKNLVIFRTRY